MRIGVLTGGGDCPGLNAVIRAVARRLFRHGYRIIGIREGWGGLIDGDFVELGPRSIGGILHRGGTILGTSRRTPLKEQGGVEKAQENWKRQGLYALVVIGGEGSLSVARIMYTEHGMPCVGVPKTIDNDLGGTDFTFGFDTAVTLATDAIDRLHTTAEAHNRVIVVEVMGRHVGWIGVVSAIAGGADVVLIPDHPMTVDEACRRIQRRHEQGKKFSIVVVSEGYELQYEDGGSRMVARGTDEFGRPRLGGIGSALAREIQARTGYDTRVTNLGYVQRGGTPTAHDRILATRLGIKAADLVHEGKFGRMSALRGSDIVDVALEDATAQLKTVSKTWWEAAEALAG